MSDKAREIQRLLIVDDSKVIRVTARKILRDHFEIIEAVDGENAWEILGSEPPVALVVSDLTMPKLDGFSLLKRIRGSHLPHIRELPVIIITGANDTETTMEHARQAGATDFIGKPFDAVHLLARTQAHANSHAVTNTLRKENIALEERSTVDPLTGLANEAAFMERGYQLLSYAIRHNQTLTLFRIEIDRYGALYREYGKSFSSSIIQALGKILETSIRQEDIVARTGTARFALLLPGLNKTAIHQLAERILSGISTRVFKSGNDKATVTVSIGAASPEIRRDTRLSELVSAADERLSLAIGAGGNQVIYEVPAPGSVQPMPEAATDNPAKVIFLGTKPSSPAGRAPLFHGEDMEVEEIEIFSPGSRYDHFGAAGKNDTKDTQRRTARAPEHVSNSHVAPPTRGKTVIPAAAAPHRERAISNPRPAPAPAAGKVMPATSRNAVQIKPTGGTDRGTAAIPAPVSAVTVADRSKETMAAPGAQTLPVKESHGIIKAEPRTRRPGRLKRMLAWLGLIRSRK